MDQVSEWSKDGPQMCGETLVPGYMDAGSAQPCWFTFCKAELDQNLLLRPSEARTSGWCGAVNGDDEQDTQADDLARESVEPTSE